MKPEKSSPVPRAEDQPKKWALVNTLGGPTFFLLMLALPISSIEFPIRAALGLMVWMAWWWISTPVHLAITGFLPLVTASLFNYVPTSLVLPSYAGELIILLIGSSMLTTVWTRWGLDRRVAVAPAPAGRHECITSDCRLVRRQCRPDCTATEHRGGGDDDSDRGGNAPGRSAFPIYGTTASPPRWSWPWHGARARAHLRPRWAAP